MANDAAFSSPGAPQGAGLSSPDPLTIESGVPAVLDAAMLDRLITLLRHQGYRVIGPTQSDGALIYDEISSLDALPQGWTDRAEPGAVRLEPSGTAARFGCSIAGQGWKRFLYPPRQRLFAAERAGEGFRLLDDDAPPAPLAFLGVRACELAGMMVQDKVFGAGPGFDEPGYQNRRRTALVIAVECARSVSTCFCASAGTGPALGAGADIRLNEILEDGQALYIAQAGSERGRALLAQLDAVPVTQPQLDQAAAQPRQAAETQQRALAPDAAAILQGALDNPHWAEVGNRCLTCGSCTMVCPTCFCTTVEDVTDLSGLRAERWRRWDSCFTIDYAYIHGGSLRTSAGARYRQWIGHKLSTWHSQFGMSGCVGCGRCIAWCPVGIDITQELGALQRLAKAEAPENDAPRNGR